MFWLKIICLIALVAIAYQDIKDRAVSWFWFPLLAIAVGILHYSNSIFEVFVTHLLINLGFVVVVVLLLYIYITIRGQHQFKNAIGIGDLVLFIVLCPSMASLSFLVCFVFSILLALVLSFFFNKKDKRHIPLAGYMSLFFLIIYLAHWSGFIEHLYSI